MRPKIKLATIALVLSLCACASNTPSRVGAAATTPLSDLNIVRADIPTVLAEAQKQPYLAPADRNCEAISAEIPKLDEVLGADLDTPVSENKITAGSIRRAFLKGIAASQSCTSLRPAIQVAASSVAQTAN